MSRLKPCAHACRHRASLRSPRSLRDARWTLSVARCPLHTARRTLNNARCPLLHANNRRARLAGPKRRIWNNYVQKQGQYKLPLKALKSPTGHALPT